MKVKFVKKDGFKVIGMKSFINLQEENTIPQLWMSFMTRYEEVKNKTNPSVTYGICEMTAQSAAEPYKFNEIVSTQVDTLDFVPEDMVSKELPPKEYAVFTHKGKINGGDNPLEKTYCHIFMEWLPSSGYEVDGDFNFELYDERYIPDALENSDDSEFDIYIPVRAR